MPELDIVCPSGLKGVVRGLQGSELDLFANRQEVQRRRVSRKVLASCWVKTTELGPAYPTLDAEKSLNFDKILMCDRFYALLMIRVATHGSEYEFRVQCTNDACRKRYEWVLDLVKDLQVYELPDTSISTITSGDLFWTDLGSERVGFKLMYGADEDTAVKAQDIAPDQMATTSIMQRVKKVERADGETIDHAGDIRAWAKKLPYAPTMDLVDSMDQVDGGVETNIEVQCQHCGNMEDISLPLAEDFWSPRRRARSGNRKVRQPNQAF